MLRSTQFVVTSEGRQLCVGEVKSAGKVLSVDEIKALLST